MPRVAQSFGTVPGPNARGASLPGDGALAARRAQVDAGLAAQLARILAADEEIGPMLLARATGENSPFGESGRAALRADVSDSTGAQLSSEQQRIRRAFASALAGGVSGGQLAAESSAARKAAAANRQGMRDVDVRTRVEDFGAQERGQQHLSAFRAAQSQLAADRLAQLIAFNSRFEVTGESPFGGLGGGGGAGGRPGGAGGGFPSGSGGATDEFGNVIGTNMTFGPEGAYPLRPQDVRKSPTGTPIGLGTLNPSLTPGGTGRVGTGTTLGGMGLGFGTSIGRAPAGLPTGRPVDRGVEAAMVQRGQQQWDAAQALARSLAFQAGPQGQFLATNTGTDQTGRRGRVTGPLATPSIKQPRY